jgi:hypothetical protein
MAAEPTPPGGQLDLLDQDKPPFAGSWRGVYALVLGALALLIALSSIVAAVYK